MKICANIGDEAATHTFVDPLHESLFLATAQPRLAPTAHSGIQRWNPPCDPTVGVALETVRRPSIF
jgi:hypothetical protein